MADPHAVTRAAERYGLALTLHDLDAIMLAITDAKLRLRSTACLQRIQPGGIELWFVDACGQRVRVAYNPERAWVVSVLPMKDGSELKKRARDKSGARGRERRERPVAEVWE